MRFVILTGLSGAGKTTALHALEDIGFFTTDNVPPALWSDLVSEAESNERHKVVVGLDVRTRHFLSDVAGCIDALKARDINPEIIFLDATDSVLIKRYNFTRRTHPLGEAPLSVDIAQERKVLSYLRAHADTLIDTSTLSARDLKETLYNRFGAGEHFRLRLVSFGFKRGVPIDADNVFDLRFLPNPFYDPSLRQIDGRDSRVQAYVFTPKAMTFYTELRDFIKQVTELAQASGRSSYTIAVGCTGGQHRSVAVAERLSHDLAESFRPHLEHRDVEAALQEHAETS